MDQPVTRQEHEELKKRVEKIERQTEPIPATTRIEVASADVLNQLKALDQGQQALKRLLLDETNKKLEAVQENTNTVKIQIEGSIADIRVVKANQSDLREYIEGQFKFVEDNQERHQELLGTLLNFAESHDALLKNTATKEDIAPMATKDDLSQLRNELKSDMTAMETRIIDTVTRLLQQRGQQ